MELVVLSADQATRAFSDRCWVRELEGSDMDKREYKAPELEEYGTVADLTQVGQTQPGDDTLPGDAKGKDGGSVNPGGLG